MSPAGENIQHLRARNLSIAKGTGASPATAETRVGGLWSMSEGAGEILIVYKLYEAWKVLILSSKWQTKDKTKYRASEITTFATLYSHYKNKMIVKLCQSLLLYKFK